MRHAPVLRSILPTPLQALALLLAVTALLLWHALAYPAPWLLDMGAAGDTRFAARFFPAEVDAGTTFRWSGTNSRLLLHGTPHAPLLLTLRLHGDERAGADDWVLWLKHERDKEAPPLATLTMQPGWRTYHVLLPAGAATTGLQAQQLYLLSSDYRYVERDHRSLGAPLDWARLTVLPGGGGAARLWLALQRSLLLTWALALLAGGAWRLRAAITGNTTLLKAGWWRCWGVLVALLAVLATLLVAWAYGSPYTLAWALPPLPWALGLATLLLLVTAPPWAAQRRAPLPGALPPVAAVALLAGAQVLFHTRWSVAAGIVLACGGVMLLALLPRHPEDASTGSGRAPQHRMPTLAVLLLIFGVALALRCYRIAELPYGLWRDEVRHGMFAIRMLENPEYRPVYISEGGVNMPAMGFYPFAAAIALWGTHIWSMRLVTAIAGALTIFPLYGVVVRLSGRHGVALLAAALLAISSWHITLSRFGFPSIIEPLLMLTGLWLLLRTEQREQGRVLRSLALVLAGAVLGISAQMYHTGRAVPLIVGGLVLLLEFVREHQTPLLALLLRLVWRWLPLALGFAFATAPLISYAVQQSEAYNARVGGVFLLSEGALKGHPPLAALDESLGKHALMFNVQGDANGRHHAPGYPLLDAITGLGFLAGCGVLLRRWREWWALVLAGALLITMLPSLLAVQGPHAMRSIGAVAFACTIAALGWAAIGRLLLQQGQHAWVARVRRVGVSVVVVAALLLNVWVYFVAMPVMPGVWLSFYPIHTRVGVYVQQLADEHGAAYVRQVYVPQGLTENDVFRYLVYGLPVQVFKGSAVSQPVEPGALFVLSGYSDEKNAENLAPYIGTAPEPVLLGPRLPGRDEHSFVVYQAVGE